MTCVLVEVVLVTDFGKNYPTPSQTCQFTPTDYYPNIPAFETLHTRSNGAITFDPRSVDARSAVIPKDSIVTMLLAFHHSTPEDAQQILHNAIRQNAPIAIFEIQQRSLFDVLLMLVHFPICWLITPFMKPSLTQLLFNLFDTHHSILHCLGWNGVITANVHPICTE